MADDRRQKWPHYAEWARQDSAESCKRIIAELRPLVDDLRQFTQTEQVRRVAAAVIEAQDALIKLESVK